ncbi:MAG: BTAD domain-containing putative transcriptional regulator, partial [Acidimicrobiales bacterium]
NGLVEQWLSVLEIDLDRRIESNPRAAIGRLTELTAAYPFSEGLWALLMTALYRVGRQADALAAYRRARQHLVDQLGVEPGPRLRELESLILGHDEQLQVDRSSTSTALALPTGTVTFGFTDLEGASRLWASHLHGTAAAMARHDELVRASVAEHRGYVFVSGGESFGVAFHRASDAVAWADELQAAMSAEPWSGGLQIRLRIALHTGETEERRSSYFGTAVNTTARIAAAGHGGQTLVSGVTAALVNIASLRDLGTYRLDGVVAERRIFQLGGAEYPALQVGDRRRGNLPQRMGHLFGRLEDLETVDEALAASPVVTLVGPGGIGKTRLALTAASRSEVGLSGGAWLIELAGIATSSDVPQ